MFTSLCNVHSDMSRVVKQKRHGPKYAYYTQTFDVVFHCGSTEMTAQICWLENVRPVCLVYTTRTNLRVTALG